MTLLFLGKVQDKSLLFEEWISELSSNTLQDTQQTRPFSKEDNYLLSPYTCNTF